MSRAPRRATRDLGVHGEALAERHLVGLGARLLERNFRAPAGELDLVVEHEGDLVGVEVKTRVLGQAGLPEEAVGPAKLERLARALAQLAQQKGYEDWGWRIDVVAVDVQPDGTPERVEHIRDAYG